MQATDNNEIERQQDQTPVHNRLPARLTPRERKVELKAQEGVIERWRRDGFKAGQAFAIIRAQRLYRGMVVEDQTLKTFPQYCQVRWGIDASRARQLIGFARAAEQLTAATAIEPQNEGQMRPLLRLISKEPAKAAEVWKRAAESAEGATPTERQVRAAMQQAEPVPEPKPEPPPDEPAAAPQVFGLGTPEALDSDLLASLDSWRDRAKSLLETLDTWAYRTEGLNTEQRQTLRERLREIAAVNRELRSLL
jgi:hypothetical protein